MSEISQAAKDAAAVWADACAAMPNIGEDPLKNQALNGISQAKDRIMNAMSLQQRGVPDQTALVWRIDLSHLHGDHTWLAAYREGHDRRLSEIQSENKRLRDALEKIAAWSDGETVSASFDEPASASIAREALK